ncbi:MAG: hypothetical protein J6D03_06730 [Clostridia bacterium]|nr:hypothetical protein [Clostridia bacterium]
MYINIDSNTIIDTKDIIGIFNINNINKKTEESFFRLVNIQDNCIYKYKSVVLTKKEDKIYTYISKFSSITLKNRISI